MRKELAVQAPFAEKYNYKLWLLILDFRLANVSFALDTAVSENPFNDPETCEIVFFPFAVPSKYHAAAPVASPANNRVPVFELFFNIIVDFLIILNTV
ncbi:hypothetical protein [Desertivirga brevis]|uniref:hypothetical protein n=1 Tax=Desertivirga brevis TaxID=2810310 RepID=UPI001A95C4AC|nr:hypothetical protein [Pedobacter sp. SYSU D00873]